MAMAEVSFLIATRNRAPLLAEAVESVRREGSDVEVIVVDDASTDATPEVCKKLSGIRYLRLDSHRGTAEARNVGLLKAIPSS
jgi:glycosyltransferase involved in cell wall biosynthesis